MMADPHYFINKKSWHYRYYSWVRKLYLGQKDTKEATSICPYFHTMLWGTVCAVLASPLLLFSAVGLRILRLILKINNPVVDWVDSKTPIGDLAKDGRKTIEDRPVVGAIISGVGLVLAVGFVLLALCGLCALVYYLPQILNGIVVGAERVAWVLLYIGWFAFWLFGHIAWGLEWTGYGIKVTAFAIVDFLANGAMWWAILSIILWGLAGIVGVCTVGLLFWGISKIPLMRRFGGWLMMRVNGYEHQREIRAERLNQRKKVKEEAKQWMCSYCGGTNYITERSYSSKSCYHCGRRNPNVKYSVWERLCSWFGDFGTKEICLPRRPAWVSLGFLSSISAGLWAIKHRVCPALTFVTDEELQQKVQEAVAADNNDELAKRAAGICNALKCPECEKELNIMGSVVGETIKCSGCEHIFVVPNRRLYRL